MDERKKNNQARIVGWINSQFYKSHEYLGETYYEVEVMVPRKSESVDMIPVMVSERLIDVSKNLSGQMVEIRGQFRSRNYYENRIRHLTLDVFAQEVEFPLRDSVYQNDLYLDGFLCRQPVFRKTPFGREIADVLLAVNRDFRGKSDYIPCICWGRTARYIAQLQTGTRVRIWGRVQSRSYQKRVNEDDIVNRVAYEVSVLRVEFPE